MLAGRARAEILTPDTNWSKNDQFVSGRTILRLARVHENTAMATL